MSSKIQCAYKLSTSNPGRRSSSKNILIGSGKVNRHLTAAKQIIIREGKPMHIKEITKIAVAEKLINDTKTPEATMGARVGDEIRKNGKKSEFIRIGKGMYTLRSICTSQILVEPNKNAKNTIIDVDKSGMDAITLKITVDGGKVAVTIRFTITDCKELITKLTTVL